MSCFRKPGNYFFLVPWIAFIPWYGMLIAMLVCWAAQGHPIYWFMHTEQFPVYISDIGATNLRPLFIACAGWQGLGYVCVVLLELFQRYKFWMNPWFTIHERNLIWSSFVFGCIGELGLLFCSIFSTVRYHKVHISMLCVFIVFMFLSICCLTAEYYMLGRYYAMIHYKNGLGPNQIIDPGLVHWYKMEGYKWNKFTISAIFKTFWTVCAVIWAVLFAALSDSKAAAFEWLLAFWFGVIFIIISFDFYLGSIWKKSKYFPKLKNFNGFYKYEEYKQKNQENFKSSDSTIGSIGTNDEDNSGYVYTRTGPIAEV